MMIFELFSDEEALRSKSSESHDGVGHIRIVDTRERSEESVKYNRVSVSLNRCIRSVDI